MAPKTRAPSENKNVVLLQNWKNSIDQEIVEDIQNINFNALINNDTFSATFQNKLFNFFINSISDDLINDNYNNNFNPFLAKTSRTIKKYIINKNEFATKDKRTNYKSIRSNDSTYFIFELKYILLEHIKTQNVEYNLFDQKNLTKYKLGYFIKNDQNFEKLQEILNVFCEHILESIKHDKQSGIFENTVLFKNTVLNNNVEITTELLIEEISRLKSQTDYPAIDSYSKKKKYIFNNIKDKIIINGFDKFNAISTALTHKINEYMTKFDINKISQIINILLSLNDKSQTPPKGKEKFFAEYENKYNELAGGTAPTSAAPTEPIAAAPKCDDEKLRTAHLKDVYDSLRENYNTILKAGNIQELERNYSDIEYITDINNKPNIDNFLGAKSQSIIKKLQECGPAIVENLILKSKLNEQDKTLKKLQANDELLTNIYNSFTSKDAKQTLYNAPPKAASPTALATYNAIKDAIIAKITELSSQNQRLTDENAYLTQQISESRENIYNKFKTEFGSETDNGYNSPGFPETFNPNNPLETFGKIIESIKKKIDELRKPKEVAAAEAVDLGKLAASLNAAAQAVGGETAVAFDATAADAMDSARGIIEAATAALAAAKAKAEAAEEQSRQIQSLSDAANARATEFLTENSALKAELDKLHAALASKNEAAETAAATAATNAAELAELRSALATAQAQTAAAATASDTAAANAAELTALQRALAAAQAQAAAAAAETQRLTGQLAAKDAEIADVQAALAAATAAAEASRAAAATGDAAAAAAADKDAEIARLRSQLAALTAERNALSAQLANAQAAQQAAEEAQRAAEAAQQAVQAEAATEITGLQANLDAERAAKDEAITALNTEKSALAAEIASLNEQLSAARAAATPAVGSDNRVFIAADDSDSAIKTLNKILAAANPSSPNGVKFETLLRFEQLFAKLGAALAKAKSPAPLYARYLVQAAPPAVASDAAGAAVVAKEADVAPEAAEVWPVIAAAASSPAAGSGGPSGPASGSGGPGGPELPPIRGGAGGAAAQKLLASVAGTIAANRISPQRKLGFFGGSFFAVIACYTFVMALARRGLLKTMQAIGIAFLMTYFLLMALFVLRREFASGMPLIAVIVHFAVIYVILISTMKEPISAIPATEAERQALMERASSRIFATWILASISVSFV